MAKVTAEQMAQLQALQPSDVMSVYSGKALACCCGCSGKHSYNSAHVEAGTQVRGYKVDADEVSDLNVKRILRLVQGAAEVDAGENYFSTIVGKRVYIVYPLPAKYKVAAARPAVLSLDCVQLATLLRELKPKRGSNLHSFHQWEHTVTAISDALDDVGPDFDERGFLLACGVPRYMVDPDAPRTYPVERSDGKVVRVTVPPNDCGVRFEEAGPDKVCTLPAGHAGPHEG